MPVFPLIYAVNIFNFASKNKVLSDILDYRKDSILVYFDLTSQSTAKVTWSLPAFMVKVLQKGLL